MKQFWSVYDLSLICLGVIDFPSAYGTIFAIHIQSSSDAMTTEAVVAASNTVYICHDIQA